MYQRPTASLSSDDATRGRNVNDEGDAVVSEEAIVDRGLSHTPRVRRGYAETLLRNKTAVTAPLLVCLAVSLALVLVLTKPSYQSTTSLWTDAALPNTSTIVAGANGTSPSANYQQVLNELLSTDTFLVSVAKRTPLAPEVTDPASPEGRAALAGLAKAFSATTPGPQILAVTAKQPTPELAVAVARAVGNELIAQVRARLVQRDQALLSLDRRLLADDQKAVNAAQQSLAAYVLLHPARVASQPDTATNQLTATLAAAQTQLASAQNQYDQDVATASQANDASVLSVFDAPSPPVATGRMKKLVFAAAGGLLAGLLLSTGVLYLLSLADPLVRSEADVKGLLALRVIGAVDELPRLSDPRSAP